MTKAGLALCVVLFWPSGPLLAQVGHDEVRGLYANRFGFDRRGVPLVTVRIMEGQKRVTITARGGVQLQAFGAESTRVTGAPAWTVTVRQAQPARIRHWVVLDRIPGTLSRARRGRLVRQWQARGLKVRTLEVGTLFAVGGRVVDNRTTLVTAAPDPNQGVALAKARRLGARFKRRTTLYAELLRPPRGQVVAHPHGSRLQVVNADVLWFAPATQPRLTVKRVEFGRGYSWHGFRDRQYFGRIYVTVDRQGKLAVVNEVPADHLLFGLVPAEIFTTAPMEALKSQAVAARGQLLAKIGTRHTTDPYLICSAQHCQVYSGAGHEHARTTRAVRETRGLILVDSRGRLADTVYSANAGGFTEHNEHVWNTPPNPNLRGHLDASWATAKQLRQYVGGINNRNIRAWLKASPRCFGNLASLGSRGRFRWTRRINQLEINRLIRRHARRIGRVRRIRVLARGISGRATAIRVTGTTSQVDIHGELAIRRALGNLKSSMFVIDHLRSNSGLTDFLFRGGGWGHGVGMCQTGAIGMAESKRTFRQILAHYYRQTRLLKLY